MPVDPQIWLACGRRLPLLGADLDILGLWVQVWDDEMRSPLLSSTATYMY